MSDFGVAISSERIGIECRVCDATLSTPYTGEGLADVAAFKAEHQHPRSAA